MSRPWPPADVEADVGMGISAAPAGRPECYERTRAKPGLPEPRLPTETSVQADRTSPVLRTPPGVCMSHHLARGLCGAGLWSRRRVREGIRRSRQASGLLQCRHTSCRPCEVMQLSWGGLVFFFVGRDGRRMSGDARLFLGDRLRAPSCLRAWEWRRFATVAVADCTWIARRSLPGSGQWSIERGRGLGLHSCCSGPG